MFELLFHLTIMLMLTNDYSQGDDDYDEDNDGVSYSMLITIDATAVMARRRQLKC